MFEVARDFQYFIHFSNDGASMALGAPKKWMWSGMTTYRPTSHFDASFNNTNPLYNFMTCNLGLHTAHHYRPGMHWSLLPALHAEIESRIPRKMINPNFW